MTPDKVLKITIPIPVDRNVTFVTVLVVLFCSQGQNNENGASQVCLTWNVTTERLILTCTIYDLRHKVYIINPYGSLQAECFPPYPSVSCEKFYKNGTINQYTKTNETIYIAEGKIDNSINGRWTCLHGTNRGIGDADITVLPETCKDCNKTTYSKKELDMGWSDVHCIAVSVCFALIGFLPSLFVTLILLSLGKCNKRVIDDCLKRLSIPCVNDKKKAVSAAKKILFFGLTLIFFGACVIASYVNSDTCTVQYVFMILAIIFGSIGSLIFLNKEDSIDNHTSDNEGTTPKTISGTAEPLMKPEITSETSL